MGLYFRDFDELAPGEVERHRESAKRLTGRTDVGGKLQLTNRAVRYRATWFDALFRKDKGDWACSLSDITSASVDPGGVKRQRGNGVAGLRAKVVITTATGNEARIVVPKPERTCQLIREAMRDANVKP